ncbi:S1 family peptidase [Vibrio ziniensis]|uniref:Trypsin-like peptidase domain-containing protein n=1 Tax=Vibrio ziniensis TaxID=2711221 RepID=A0A6G7CME6_9VIBR|nr:serine protease [Vibrio ziniensis]QIH43307.1 trypsin-like peptidase domain-containing protein [Vibrio ziniensis]
MIRPTLVLVLLTLVKPISSLAGLPETIATIQPSVVGVGTYNRLSERPYNILGTGFVVGDGHYIATNNHVIPAILESQNNEKVIIYAGKGNAAKVYNAEIVTRNSIHDIAILKIEGLPLPALHLSSKMVREGEVYAFTGYPLGAILGLYPVTHRGIISSITPIVIPARNEAELTAKRIKQLREPYIVYQLDAVAYPGNSGSPVYDPDTGEVIAVINKVLVKSTKESMLTDPSAITYAIPIKYLRDILTKLP